MRLIVTGATGTAGSEVLRQALLDPRVEAVTVFSRRPLPPHVDPSPPSAKLEVILHDDFSSYPPSLLERLKGHDSCIWALGKSSVGMKEADYERLTVDWPLAAAKAFEGLRVGDGGERRKFVFAYVSGHGTDQEEGKASAMFGRVKGLTLSTSRIAGKAERVLADLPSSGSPYLAPYSFRPAGIFPVQPTPELSWLHRGAVGIAKPIFFTLMPSMAIKADDLARGMIEACLKAVKSEASEIEGWPGKGKLGNEATFDTNEIKALARGEAAK
ncbi:hypothetical protein JCM8097_005041 [Rhodosporidiobolus ruineniae]